jgi:hypothetical protein
MFISREKKVIRSFIWAQRHNGAYITKRNQGKQKESAPDLLAHYFSPWVLRFERK